MRDHLPYPRAFGNHILTKEPVPQKIPGHVAVVGAGPAGLMAAEVLARGGVSVTVFDQMPSPGRKLLLAGRGGLNLTHSEDEALFLTRYGHAAGRLGPLIQRFGPIALRNWCEELGLQTFVGSSGRVFPVSFKTSPLLRAWLRRLGSSGVRFAFRHRWHGWDDVGRLRFEAPEGEVAIGADATVLALGGASWPQLGSDGRWVETLRAAGIGVAPLAPANCGFRALWSDAFRDRFEGQPLKTAAVAFEGARVRGDIIITWAGLEGAPIYALAAPLREAIARHGETILSVALRPDLTADAIVGRLGKRRAKESVSNTLRKTLGLAPAAIGLLREAELAPHGALRGLSVRALADLINNVPVRLLAPMPIARAISTAGGIRFADLDTELMLRPGLFVVGEMIDWEAPTGGYLLQACFATGVAGARGALAWLSRAGADAPNISVNE